MFTAENFRRIYDGENRKGLDLAARFFPQLEPHTEAIRDKVAEIRELRAKTASIKPEVFTQSLGILKAALATLKSSKSSAIDDALEQVSLRVMAPGFQISLEQKLGPKGKAVFCIDGSAETFFVIKQLQSNLNRLYGVKQANRHDLVCQVRDTVNGRFPYEIVRTDISSFYESIDRKTLLGKLDGDHLLSPSSKTFIKQVLKAYGALAATDVGIPRGVGISAYLAELYLRSIDREIRQISGLVLYCRYVDDILVVFARPPTGKHSGPYKDLIVKILTKGGLTHNIKKTNEFDLGAQGNIKFEYLGYRFLLANKKCLIKPSAAKVAKYKRRLNASFQEYVLTSPFNSRRAYRTLVSRIKFLTGNTRLSNSKSNAVTGIYYNNSAVTDTSSFTILDGVLKRKVASLKRPSLRARLKPFRFVDGFSQRRFHNFSAKELQNIVRAWKHG